MKRKLWRTLVRVIARDEDESYVDYGAWCVFPGWMSGIAIHVPATEFGNDWPRIQPGVRFIARATIGVPSGRIDLFFIDGPFEFSGE